MAINVVYPLSHIEKKNRKTAHPGKPVSRRVATLLEKVSALEKRLHLLETASRGAAKINKARAVAKTRLDARTGATKSKSAKVDTRTVAVISSAIAALIEKPHRIVSVVPVGEARAQSANPWTLHGRLSLHQIRSSAAWLRRGAFGRA
jgi:hypothetical protein